MNEQEIAHWEAQTVKEQEVMIELMTVLGTLTNLKRVWYEGNETDKKGLVNSIFEYILFDLDTEQITDFRLKPWADQYLIVPLKPSIKFLQTIDFPQSVSLQRILNLNNR